MERKIKFFGKIIKKECNNIMKEKRNKEYLAMLDKSMAEAKTGGFTLEKDVGKIKQEKCKLLLINCEAVIRL